MLPKVTKNRKKWDKRNTRIVVQKTLKLFVPCTPKSCQYPFINYLIQDDSAAQSYEKSSIRRRNPRMLTEPFSNSSNDDIASNEIDSLKKRVCFRHYAKSCITFNFLITYFHESVIYEFFQEVCEICFLLK